MAAGVSQCAASFDVLFFFDLILLGDPAVAWRKLQVTLGGDSCLQLSAPFEFGVQFRAEEQSQVGDPQPQQKHDDPCQRTVRLVVTTEIADVETKAHRRKDPHQDRHASADADPAKFWLSDVRCGVIQHGHCQGHEYQD